ncbi:MAG TPA: SusC/RagA family TonB-linked outer membrane protein [Flavisolibacter sp.]|jgi:TonB-linked SusC/RagA family outer membrane protein|nr:SusC/RagA family TonB-linked outer membrane protein [Flavisolibacter sp.]
MRQFVLLVLITISTVLSYAQQRTISGKITDATGEPVPGASVKVKGTQKGTIADATGSFSLSAQPGDILVISAVGISTREIPVTANTTTYNVGLTRQNQEMSEVVVTALGVRREKKALGYAVQEVKGENLTIAKSTDVSSSLAGKVAGVQLVGSPSSTFDNADIIIRGVTGLGVSTPLFIVDGTPTNQSAVIMDNVESVSVLKGAAATALYGQRARDGVVVITTKKGTRRRSTSVEVNLGATIEKIALLPPYQNQYAGGYSSSYTSKNSLGAGYLDDQGFYIFKYRPSVHPASWAAFDGQRMLEYGADESWGPKMEGQQYRAYWSWYPGAEFGQLTPLTPQPDNIKNFFQTGRNLNNSVSLTSGGETHNFRFTYGNQNRTLVVPNAKRDQHQLAVNGSFDMSKAIVLSTDLTYTNAYTKGQPREGYRLDGLNVTQNFNQWFQRQLDLERMKRYREPDGSLNSWNIGDPNNASDIATYGKPQYWDNPYYVIEENFGTQRHNRLVGNVGLNIKFNSHLNLQSFVRTNTYSNENDSRIASGGLNQDYYEILQNTYREMNYESNLMYRNRFGDFSVDGMLGANIRTNYYSQLRENTTGGLSSANYFDIRASVGRPDIARTYNKYQVNSQYARASFGYKDMAFIDATIRRDASSTLPADNNTYIYPSISGSFIFSELTKMALPWLSYGKIRGNFAQVGADLDPHSLDLAINNGSFYGSNPSVTIGNQFRGGAIEPALTKGYEFGVELKFFNRIGLDVSVYKNNNINQILAVDVSPASGFTTAQINAGNIVNEGLEISLSGTPVQSRDFSWDVTVNWAKNRNKVEELYPGLNSYLYATNRYDTRLEHRVGGEWGMYYGRKWRVDEKTGKTIINASGQPEYDINQPIGQVLPRWTGGTYQSIRYKGIDLSFNLDFQSGGLFYSETRNFGTGSGLTQETVGVNDKGHDWRDYPGSYTLAGGNTGNGGIRIPGVFANGQENNRYISARAYWYTARQRDARNVLLDASYVKLREVRLGYTFPQSVLRAVKYAKSANLGFIVSNAWLIWANTKKYGVDPSELEVFYREGGQLSSTRQFGLNLRVIF